MKFGGGTTPVVLGSCLYANIYPGFRFSAILSNSPRRPCDGCLADATDTVPLFFALESPKSAVFLDWKDEVIT